MATTKDPLRINAGDLRHAVTILRPVVSMGVAGSMTDWEPVAVVRAAIEPLRGTDLIRAGQDVTQNYIEVTIRYRPGVSAQMRLQTKFGQFIIQSANNILERNRVLKLTCLALGVNG